MNKMIKSCPKPRCNGKLVEHPIHGLLAEEWEEDIAYKCNKCGYVPSIEEYKRL